MVEWIVGLSVTGTVLRLIRICPAIRAPPDSFEFFKLFAINFIANTRRKIRAQNFLGIWGLQILISDIVKK